jgi:hypothetical protein
LRVYLAVLLGYLLLLPPQLNMSILDTLLPPYRIFLIFAFFDVAVSVLRGNLRLVWPDLLILGAVGWICFAIFQTTPMPASAVASIAQTLDMAVAYLFVRIAFRSLSDVRVFLLLFLPGLAITSAVIAVEAISHKPFMQSTFAKLTGASTPLRYDYRLGLLRARGPFPHPILAGIFIASFLPLYWLSGLRKGAWVLGVLAAIGAFFSVSSAALLSLAMGAGLVAYNWASERIAFLTWRLFLIVIAMVVVVIELGTNSGTFNLMMQFGALNTTSAYNRVLIWEYGSQNVLQRPWFGLGYADWDRPGWMMGSVDHYWLLLAMQFGIVSPVLLGLALIWGGVALIQRTMVANFTDARLQRGLIFAMAVYAIAAISVSLWLQAQVWFFVLIAMVVSIAYAPMMVRVAPLGTHLPLGPGRGRLLELGASDRIEPVAGGPPTR